LFTYSSSSHTIYILIYVDDIIITDNNTSAIRTLIQSLDSQFSLKDHGFLTYFLEVEVTTNKSGLHLTQSGYLQSILHKANMQGEKPCNTLLQAGVQLFKTKLDGTPLFDPVPFRTFIGMLQYATITRHDSTFAVNKVSQFFAQPTCVHWQAVKRILRYIQGTLQCGLHLKPSHDLYVQAFCDVDWACYPNDRRSTISFVIFLGPNIVFWSSKK
jgi:Reverse transcriptase (RNA-dependent DNA polymerase)